MSLLNNTACGNTGNANKSDVVTIYFHIGDKELKKYSVQPTDTRDTMHIE